MFVCVCECVCAQRACTVLCSSQVAGADTKTRPLKDKGGLKPNPVSVNHSPHTTLTCAHTRTHTHAHKRKTKGDWPRVRKKGGFFRGVRRGRGERENAAMI